MQSKSYKFRAFVTKHCPYLRPAQLYSLAQVTKLNEFSYTRKASRKSSTVGATRVVSQPHISLLMMTLRERRLSLKVLLALQQHHPVLVSECLGKLVEEPRRRTPKVAPSYKRLRKFEKLCARPLYMPYPGTH